MRRIHATDVVRMAVAWFVAAVALGVAVDVLPGVEAHGIWPVLATSAVTGVVAVLVRPVLVEVAARVGWLVVGIAALTAQAIAMQVALWLVPGIDSSSFWTTLAASWIAAAVGTVLSWLLAAGTPDEFSAALRRTGRRWPPVPDPEIDGMVFIQLDGVSYPVMQWALRSGLMPTLHRWIQDGSHGLHEWTVQLPCTTPASQLGILHGTCDGVPAFRWYDRELDRMLVANRPADAAVIEARASSGHGLLADGGISVSNLFSGDAPRSSMVMSKAQLSRGSRETRRAFGWFLVRPDGFARSVSRTVAEIVRERFQARQQRLRSVRPRVSRSWTFAVLRAITNGLLRDMNTAIVADEIMRGTRSIYVDYVDYDEVAHHAGGTRLESLASLQALDQVVTTLARVAQDAPRHYRFVALSDHGQSMGTPFAERFEDDLPGLCAHLLSQDVTGVDDSVESWGRVESMVDDLAGDGKTSQSAVRRVGDQLRERTDATAPGATPVVLGSGNLGLLYFPTPERLFLEDVEQQHPRLLGGLMTHPGISFVALLSRTAGPVVLGADGRHVLDTGDVVGVDPLHPFGTYARSMVATAVRMHNAPDVYVNSTVEPSTLEIAAFEDLVGAHGGLGGWQDRAMVLAPVDLIDEPITIIGAEQLHRHLVTMLERLGHRREVPSAG